MLKAEALERMVPMTTSLEFDGNSYSMWRDRNGDVWVDLESEGKHRALSLLLNPKLNPDLREALAKATDEMMGMDYYDD